MIFFFLSKRSKIQKIQRRTKNIKNGKSETNARSPKKKNFI